MCQLTYSNMHEMYLNSLMIYLLGKIGSEKHDDGVGFICPDNSIWKCQLAAKDITNLGGIVSKFVIDDKPIPFHIRAATYGIEVTKENAHPFNGKHYILMHNGTLLPRNGEEPKDKKKDSDSKKFLDALDSARDTNKKKKFPEIFNDAMKDFAGKFAFIIREKDTNVDYIVRGRTAELWISYVIVDDKKSGYVINTSKETLKSAFHEFINIWDLFFPENVKFSEPKLLKQETIFIAKEDEIEEIGKSLEVTPVRETHSITPYRNQRNFNNWGSDEQDLEAVEIATKAYKIYDFLKEHSMGLLDFQLMIMISSGISILELTKEDLQLYIDFIIPKVSANKKVKDDVRRILNGSAFPHEIYEKYDLEYPWTVNEGEKVIKALNEYMKAV